MKAAAAAAASLLSIAIGMVWLDRLNRRSHQIGIGWFLALFLVLTTAFAVIYLKSLKQPLNARSDREDALRVELTAILHRQNPFEAHTPFYAILRLPFRGRCCWPPILCPRTHRLAELPVVRALLSFRFAYSVICDCSLLSHNFLLLSPADLSYFTSGGDYLTNFFYVAITLCLFVVCLDRPLYLSLLGALFLGVALSSRAVYVFAPIPLLTYTLRRTSRSRALGLLRISERHVVVPVSASLKISPAPKQDAPVVP